MKKITPIIFALSILSVPALAATSQSETGLYIGARAGLGHQDVSNLNVTIDNSFKVPVKDRSDNISTGSIAVGYKINSFRVELEGKLNNFFKTENARIQSNTLTANTYYDFINSSMFTPYITAGLGIAETSFRVQNFEHTDHHNEFTYNVGFGLAVSITKSMAIDLMYRYINYDHIKYNQTTGGTNIDISARNFMNEATLGLRYTF